MRNRSRYQYPAVSRQALFDFPQHQLRERHRAGGYTEIVGGEVGEYTKLMAESREQAIDRMVEEARKLNANAIVGIRFSTTEVMGRAAEILVYGTAVVVE